MKRIFKAIFYPVYKIFTKLPTKVFSEFFISLGYFIKSEAEFNNNKAEINNWDRHDVHELFSTEIIKPSDEIIFLEFGVFQGAVINHWVQNNQNPLSRFIGFDTFIGLPEDWGSIKKGSFSAEGKLPNIDDPRVSYCVGLIQDTLPNFVKNLSNDKRKIIHIDVDLYNATLITLIHLHPFLTKGDIIIFDDFYTLTKASHEFRGFLDYQLLYKISYKPLMNIRNGHHVIEII